MAQRNVKVNLMFQADTTLAQQNIQQLSGLLNQISNAKIGFDSGGIQQAAQDAKQLQVHLQNALNQDTGKIDLSKLNASLKASNTSLTQLTGSLASCGPVGQQAFAKVAMAISQAEAPMFRLSAKTRDLLNTLGNTAKWQIASTAIHGITGAISESIQYVEKFDRALTDIKMVSDLNNEQLLKFTQNTHKIAKEVNATALEVAQGSTIFFQQGLSEEQVTERIAITTKMANITGETTETVASQLTAIWNNFATDGKRSLESYADTLAYLGAKTAADTNQIATAMEKFAASAKTVGLSYDVAAASVAEVIDRTQQAPEEVGTAFKTIMSRMQGLQLGETLEDGVDLNKYGEALDVVGVKILDANDELRDADDILADLGEAWDGLGAAQKKALATTVAGVRQQTQFMALMEEWDDIEARVDSLGDSIGFVNEQNEKFGLSVAGVKKQFEEAKGELFESLFDNKTIITFTKGMTDLIKVVDNLVEAFGGLGPMIMILTGVFAKSLFPMVLNGVRNLTNNVMQMFGFTNQQVKKLRADFDQQLQLKVDSGEIDNTMAEQIRLSQQLLRTKQDLEEKTKHMGQAEKDLVKNQIAMYEYATQNLQKELDKQYALEQQVKLQKELLSSESKKDVGTAVAVNKFKDRAKEEGMSQDDQDVVIENATTRSSTEMQDEIAKLSGPNPDLIAKQQRLAELQAQQASLGADQKVYEEQLSVPYEKLEDQDTVRGMLEGNRTKDANGTFPVAKGGEAEAAQYEKLLATKEKLASVEDEILALTKQIEEAEAENAGNEEEIRLLEKSLELKKQINTETRNANEKSVVGSEDIEYDNEGDAARATGNKIFNAQMSETVSATGEGQGVSVSTTPGVDGGLGTDTLHLETSIENMTQLAAKHGELTSKIETMTNMEKDLGKTLETVNKGLKTNTKETTSSEKATKKKEGTLSSLMSKLKKTSKEEDKMAKEMKDATKNAKAFGDQVKKMAKELLKVEDGADELANIEKAMKKLESAKPEEVAEGLEILEKELKELKAGTQDAANTVDMAAGSMKSDLASVGLSGVSLDQLENALKELGLYSEDTRQKIEQLKNGMSNATPPVGTFGQKFTSITSGIASFVGQASMAMSGIQMIGSAFQEGNTPLETTITLLSGLGMVLPVITTAYKALTSAKAADTVATLGNTIATLKDTAANSANIVVKIAATVASWALAIAQFALKAITNPVGAAIALATIAIGAMAFAAMGATDSTNELTEAKIKENEAAMENAQKSTECANAWRDEADAMDNLVSKYKALKQAGEDYTSVAADIIDQAPELIKAYQDFIDQGHIDGPAKEKLEAGIEKMENAAAAGDVEAVIAAQEENDFIMAEQAYENAKSGAEASKNILGAKLAETQGDFKDGKYTAHVWGADSWFDEGNEEKKAADIVKSKMGDRFKMDGDGQGGDLTLDASDSVNFLEDYEAMVAARDEMAKQLGDELGDSDVYREINELIENTKDQYNDLKTNVETMDQFSYVKAAQNMKADGKNVTDVDSYAEYEEYKQQYKEEMKKVLEDRGLEEGTEEYDAAMDEAEKWLEAQSCLQDYIKLEKSLEHVESKFGADAKKEVADYYDALSAEERELFENVSLGTLEKIDKDSLDSAMLDAYAESLDMTSEAFEHYVDQVKAGNKNLKDNPKLARQVAKAQLEVERAMKKAGEAYKNNKDNLDKSKKGTEEFSTACAEMSGALNGVFGEDTFDAQFVADNLDMVKKAMEGDVAAMQQLQDAAGEQIMIDILPVTDASELEGVFKEVNDWIGSQEFNDLEVGATLDDSGMTDKFNEMLSNGEITVDEMNRLLKGIGFEPEIGYKDMPIDDAIASMGTTKQTMEIFDPVSGETKEVTLESLQELKSSGQATVQVPFIKGSETVKTSSPKTLAKSAGNGSGGGGGGGKPKENKTFKEKDKKKPKKYHEEFDRYKELVDVIEDYNDQLSEIQTLKDEAWGPDRLKQIDAEKKKIGELTTQQQKYINKIGEYLAIDQGELSTIDSRAQFDADGKLTNYHELTQAWLDEYNAAQEAWNTAMQEATDKYNASGKSEDDDTAYDKATEAADEALEAAEKLLEDRKTALDQWQETYDLNEEQKKQLEEYQRQIKELNYEEITYKVEFKVEMKDSELERIDYYMNKLEGDFFRSAEKALLFGDKIAPITEKLSSYYGMVDELKQKFEAGEITQANYIEGLNNAQSEMISNVEELRSLLEEVGEYYLNTLSEVNERIDAQTSKFDHYLATIEHYKNLSTMLYGEQAYDKMNNILKGQEKVVTNRISVTERELTMLNGQRDQILAEMNKAGISEQTKEKLRKDLEEIETQIMEKEESMMGDIEQLGEIALETLTNTLGAARKKFEEALAGSGSSIDSIIAQIERLNSVQEEYLTTTNKMYETNKLINQAQLDMDKTDNSRAKQQLADYIKYIEQLQKSGELSQFELELAQADYEILQKKIALEEAQEAKNQVRLTRDSEGNYGYVYTANQDNVAKAEQELADAQNARYNTALEAAQNYQDQFYQAEADLLSALEELDDQYANRLISKEEWEARRAEIVDTYLTKAEQAEDLYYKATGVMMEESTTGRLDYTLKGVGSLEELTEATETLMGDQEDAFEDYDKTMGTVAGHSEENFGKIEDGIEDTTEASQDLADELVDNLIPTLENELNDTLETTMEQWYALEEAIIAATQAVEGYLEVIGEEVQKQVPIEDYSQEIEKLVEAGQDFDDKAVQDLLAQRWKKMGGKDNYNYSEMMEEHLANGGSKNDSWYKTLEILRDYKIMMTDWSAVGTDWANDLREEKLGWDFAQKIMNYMQDPKAKWADEYVQNLLAIRQTKITENGWEDKVESNAELKKKIADALGKDVAKLNTGGYTGAWGPEGKLAVLHEKELVLNAQDTENFLGGIAVLREISQMLDNNALVASLGMLNLRAMTVNSEADKVLQQEVTIHADFPNVTDHNEIEIAIDNLINAASQHAYKI